MNMSGTDVCSKEAVSNEVVNNGNRRYRPTVVVVRHGERLDYTERAAGRNWCEANPQQPWNPPLTEKGLGMATQLGAALEASFLPELGLPPIGGIYSSPFLRCRQTAAGIVQGMSSVSSKSLENSSTLKVRVELGLAESINENWYRSWSLPGADGTWGYKKKEIPLQDLPMDQIDPRALQPVGNLLDWKESTPDTNGIVNRMTDHEYEPLTSLRGEYSFLGNPCKLESFSTQRQRMANTMNLLSDKHRKHEATSTEGIGTEDETIILVSHGGPVTHLYESLTGNGWHEHGVGKYCCFSIYQSEEEPCAPKTETNENGNKKWIPLVVNRVLWDDGKKNESINNPSR